MSLQTIWPWAVVIGGWALAAAGVVVLAWALFWDRARGRRRCPGCWYDMSGTVSMRCPECGREAKSERMFLRTRRRWKWAVVAMCGVVAALQMAEQPNRRFESRSLRWVPTLVLAAFADLEPGPNPDGLSRSLWLRNEELQWWHGAIIVLREHWPVRSEVEELVKTRTTWSAEEPVMFRLDSNLAPPILVGSRVIRARVNCDGLGSELESFTHCPDAIFICRMGLGGRDRWIAPLRAGAYEAQVEGSVERSVGGFSLVQRRWKKSVNIAVVDHTRDVLPGQDSEEMRALVQSKFVAALQPDRMIMIWWSPRPYVPPPTGFHFELVRANQVIDAVDSGDGTVFLCWDEQADASVTRSSGKTIPPELLNQLRVRISGCAATSLGMIDPQWYWSGVVEIDLREMMERFERQRAEDQTR